MIHIELAEEKERLSALDTSAGLVSRMNPVGGGHSNRTSDIAAQTAVMDASEKITTKNARAWRGVASNVYELLLSGGRSSSTNKAHHNRFLAWVMLKHVLCGIPITELTRNEGFNGTRVSAATLWRAYDSIVDLCVDEAMSWGLF